MRIDVLSIFPQTVRDFCTASLLGKAIESGLLQVEAHDLREWTTDKHNSVDDEPYGGGPGMVIRCEPVFAAHEALTADEPAHTIFFDPCGRPLTQNLVDELATRPRLLLVCGRYEGFDERITETLADDRVSIGDYVLSGGEAAAIVLIDAVARTLPGVMSDPESLVRESFRSNLLDHPHYTRPAEFRGMKVPEVLTSGNHAAIEAWRAEQALERTRRWRPDLLD